MKDKILTIVLIILVVVLAFMYVTKESGHNQALIEKDKAYQDTLNSIKLKIDSLQKEKLAWMQFATKFNQSALKWENESKIWKSRYEKEINNRRHFSDDSLDSLIGAVR